MVLEHIYVPKFQCSNILEHIWNIFIITVLCLCVCLFVYALGGSQNLTLGVFLTCFSPLFFETVSLTGISGSPVIGLDQLAIEPWGSCYLCFFSKQQDYRHLAVTPSFYQCILILRFLCSVESTLLTCLYSLVFLSFLRVGCLITLSIFKVECEPSV